MNESTPRKYKGTLLERAAERYAYGVPGEFPPLDKPRRFSDVEDAQAAPREESAVPATPTVAVAQEPVAGSPSEPPSAPEQPRNDPPLVRGKLGLSTAPRDVVAIDRDRLVEKGMLVPGAPVTALAEEMRLVKRQLLITAAAVERENGAHSRMILVGSARPNDGKTFCAINLAISLAAEKDVEILLVDADFAKPDIPATLGIEPGPGLLDALGDSSIDVERLILATDIPHLSILPAGTRSDSDTELLASARASAILDRLAAANPKRIVLFDSPPALAASSASALAMHVGQVMLVVRADSTSEADLREAVQLLDRCDHIQLLLNGVTFAPGGARFGTYYGTDSGK
ncbi:AAA family ATPase [Stakelama sp. CBK3Z-3]|uniref:AAA family ATPase n=1 Tax=Stakelama flava TaxID=2860338 RepID=A0ABS6XH45_9SPHN|nr:AAA family ATPase [Stakelama flava]MBW4329528.1 AAA family ATPase [Stakelama flava]